MIHVAASAFVAEKLRHGRTPDPWGLTSLAEGFTGLSGIWLPRFSPHPLSHCFGNALLGTEIQIGPRLSHRLYVVEFQQTNTHHSYFRNEECPPVVDLPLCPSAFIAGWNYRTAQDWPPCAPFSLRPGFAGDWTAAFRRFALWPFHRARAAFFPCSESCAALRLVARAMPPFRPLSCTSTVRVIVFPIYCNSINRSYGNGAIGMDGLRGWETSTTWTSSIQVRHPAQKNLNPRRIDFISNL